MANNVKIVDKIKQLFDIDKTRKDANVADEHSNLKLSHIKFKKKNLTIGIKNSLHGIFKSHSMASTNEDINNNTGDIQISTRGLPPIPSVNSNIDLECHETVHVDEVREQCQDYSLADIDGFKNTAAPENRETVVRTLVNFSTHFAKIQDCGWYWGPISSDYAEHLLMNEPDGSFLVRDSSDDHYIFSVSIKLTDCVRHVRIEHSQGCFSFGSFVVFRNQTIVDFIENAMTHSRNGRYLFFLHQRPTFGPLRVQLLHPVSRFKRVQSLKHICRFVILKNVRKDLISSLPLPPPLLKYLNNPQYFLE